MSKRKRELTGTGSTESLAAAFAKVLYYPAVHLRQKDADTEYTGSDSACVFGVCTVTLSAIGADSTSVLHVCARAVIL